MNKQELATKIWATANELRKNIKASEYKDYILGFMFYKYLCDKEVDYLKDLGGEIDVARRVKQRELLIARKQHCLLGKDRDAALTLQIHIVQHLILHLTLGQKACFLNNTVRKG